MQHQYVSFMISHRDLARYNWPIISLSFFLFISLLLCYAYMVFRCLFHGTLPSIDHLLSYLVVLSPSHQSVLCFFSISLGPFPLTSLLLCDISIGLSSFQYIPTTCKWQFFPSLFVVLDHILMIYISKCSF